MVKHLSMWCLTDVACHRTKKPTTIPISKTIDKAIRLAPVQSLITRQHSLYKAPRKVSCVEMLLITFGYLPGTRGPDDAAHLSF